MIFLLLVAVLSSAAAAATPEDKLLEKPVLGYRDVQSGFILARLIQNSTGIKEMFGERRVQQVWRRMIRFRLRDGVETTPRWVRVPTKGQPGSEYRIKTIMSDGTVIISQSTTLKSDALAASASIERFVPGTPNVRWMGNQSYQVEWRMPIIWKFSENYVLEVEHRKQGTDDWEQESRAFSTADSDGFMRVLLNTTSFVMRIRVVDIDYVTSKPSSTVDLRKATGEGSQMPCANGYMKDCLLYKSSADIITCFRFIFHSWSSFSFWTID
jgi:hypothetical protein